MFSRVADFHRAVGQLVADTPILPDPTIRRLRITLLEEEVGEFCTAYIVANRVEMADALADIAYIIAGTAVSYGISPDGNAPYESPYDAFLPNHHNETAIAPNDLLQAALLDYTIAERRNSLELIGLTLMNMLTEVFGVAWRLNIPINAVFAEVHRSNMAKLMPDGSVRRREDGKILKAPGWVPPDIAGVLAEMNDV